MLIKKQIKLIPLEIEDLPKARLWVNDPLLKAKMLRVLPVTQIDQEKWYKEIVENRSKIVFAIRTITGNEHIGNTGLYHIDWIHRRAEFWILIGETDFLKQGMGTESLWLMLGYAFFNLNLNKVYLNVAKDNKEAINLYRKLNFKKEGVLKEHYFIDGRYIDIIIMSVFRKDFNFEVRDKKGK